jgi:hypothetical protein
MAGNAGRRVDLERVDGVASREGLWQAGGMVTKSKKSSGSAPLTPDEALTRLRALCFGFPAVEEKASHGSPSFFVRGKQFASFTMGYGRGPSAWVKCDLESQAQIVGEEPERYFVPPYVGVKGWVGVVLGTETDWEKLGVLLEGGWDAVAPKTARDAPVLPPPKSSPKLMTTDKRLVEAVISKIETMCRTLVSEPGELEVERHNAGATMRAFGKPLCYVNDNHHNDGIVSVSVRCPLEEAEALAAKEARYYVPPYIGKRGWLAVRVDLVPLGSVDWAELGGYLAAGVVAIAPKRAVGARKKRG